MEQIKEEKKLPKTIMDGVKLWLTYILLTVAGMWLFGLLMVLIDGL